MGCRAIGYRAMGCRAVGYRAMGCRAMGCRAVGYRAIGYRHRRAAHLTWPCRRVRGATYGVQGTGAYLA